MLADGVPVGMSDGPDSALPVEVVISTQGASLDGVVMNERREPVADVVIAVVPEPSKRTRPELYRAFRSDNAGRFKVSGIAPGDYSVFVETGAWQDPEILRPFENQATRIHTSDGSQRTLELTLPNRAR